MPAGDPFDEREVREITRALRRLHEDTGVHFSVYVGNGGEDDPGQLAERAHASVHDPHHAVLVLVAPDQHRVEIVTGVSVRNALTDRDCALAALSMSSAFAGGDLTGGILTGLRMLGERVRRHGRAALR